ncbi:ribonuclease R family protein, partial [Pararhodobacter marinus]|uniref:ribonuclease R family protein n=1 Tax=Pararhodobacter marinus TaxID=2184063 RepID=UPI003519B0E3
MTKLPSKTELAQWLADQTDRPSMRDVAKAFGIKGGADKVDLKALLKELEREGLYERRKRGARGAGLPPVGIVRVTGPDAQGALLAEPADAEGRAGDKTARIVVIERPGQPAMGPGDRVLAKLLPVAEGYHAHPIRKLQSGPKLVLGIYRQGPEFGRILPIDKGADMEWRVSRDDAQGARDGELVEAEQTGPARLGLPRARITARLGDPGAPRAVSLIAIHQHGIPDQFPDAVLAEAEAAPDMPSGRREDLRALPLLTIDPSDARDHDDAVCAAPDPDAAGGFIVWVAIADVAAYVRPGSELDREARKRGNSSYFPDRVVPMLPDRLSGDLCSLHENVPRACLAVRMRIDAQGHKIDHRFTRGLMQSVASLNYQQVQNAVDGAPDEKTEALVEPILKPLYAAYSLLARAREARQPLDLDLPERRIEINDEGHVTSVAFKERLEAHKLIEEFMILANVAAAETLIPKRTPLLVRVHEEPSPDTLETLREVAQAAGLVLAKGQVLQTRHLN